MTGDDVCFLTIGEAAELISSRQLSPVELTAAHLDRIERIEPTLNSFITLLAYESLAAARATEWHTRRPPVS